MPWTWDHLPVCIPSKLEPVTWEDHSPAPLALEEGSELVSNPSHQAERGVPFPVCCPWESFPSSRARSSDQNSRGDAVAGTKEGRHIYQERGAGAAMGNGSPRLEQDLD